MLWVGSVAFDDGATAATLAGPKSNGAFKLLLYITQMFKLVQVQKQSRVPQCRKRQETAGSVYRAGHDALSGRRLHDAQLTQRLRPRRNVDAPPLFRCLEFIV